MVTLIMDHIKYFNKLISGFLKGQYTRSEIADIMATEIGIDDIDYSSSDQEGLLFNCEMALRHIDEDGYYTTERELKYYLSCLNNERTFTEKDRDDVIKNEVITS